MLPLFLKCNRHYKFCILLKFPLTGSFLCLSEAVYKLSVSAVLIVCIYLLAILFPNYIQFFQCRIWCFLPQKIRTQKPICFQLKWSENFGYSCFLLKIIFPLMKNLLSFLYLTLLCISIVFMKCFL